MDETIFYDTEWFWAVGIILALTIAYIWVATTIFGSKDFEKKFDVEGDKGTGCGCFFAIGLFVLCYLWTCVLVSNVEYGRPYTKDPRKKKVEPLFKTLNEPVKRGHNNPK